MTVWGLSAAWIRSIRTSTPEAFPDEERDELWPEGDDGGGEPETSPESDADVASDGLEVGAEADIDESPDVDVAESADGDMAVSTGGNEDATANGCATSRVTHLPSAVLLMLLLLGLLRRVAQKVSRSPL